MAAGSGNGRKHVFICCSCCFYVFLLLTEFSDCQRDNILVQGQELRDASHSQLYSETGIFILGFYLPRYSSTKFLAIWYEDEQEPVWIANRNSPISGDSGSLILTIDGNGSLKILRKGGDGYSFSLFEVEEATTTSAVLLDSGNFVLRELNADGSLKRQLWQSFDYPTDTLLPGMKLGLDHRTGSNWSLTSWRSPNSPLFGAFTLAMDPNNTNQLLILLRGEIFWTSRFWQGGFLELSREKSSIFHREARFNDFSSENETYFTCSISTAGKSQLGGGNAVPKLRLDYKGTLRWGYRSGISCHSISYVNIGNLESGCDSTCRNCDRVLCNLFGDDDFTVSATDMDGCVRRKQDKIPGCRDTSILVSGSYGFMYGNGSSIYKETANLTEYECLDICISNCDCVAFAAANDMDSTGCEIWSRGATFRHAEAGRLIWNISNYDWRFYYSGDRRLYDPVIRMEYYRRKARHRLIKIICLIGAAAVLISICLIIYSKRKMSIIKVVRKIRKQFSEERTWQHELGVRLKSFNFLRRKDRQRGDSEKMFKLQFYSFEIIAVATNNFSAENKLGEGGFGLVYKGRLPDGQEVAIKRLSKNSRQGFEEFKNEAKIIAELQHTNLVKLVGCCIYKDERLLIYEYMPNKSLDFFIFDAEKKTLLDWNKRFNIIQGIVQGLLYLHNYSRLRIIHRDIKANNILLDNEMNAKISDFGMARIFESTDFEANTRRVVGTYGYMSPEYVLDGVFSPKSDVFSFGVLLMEIITGKKNYNSYDLERPLNLVGHAWELWVDNRGVELIDSSLCNSNHTPKILRCIHISLLCVQQIPADRPIMSDVIFMIYNDAIQLPLPKPPAFFIGKSSRSSAAMVVGGETGLEICSSNDMSITEMIER